MVVTFDPGTDEGVGVVQLPLTLAQMKGLEWLLPLTLEGGGVVKLHR